jgi:hypothetical protein
MLKAIRNAIQKTSNQYSKGNLFYRIISGNYINQSHDGTFTVYGTEVSAFILTQPEWFRVIRTNGYTTIFELEF